MRNSNAVHVYTIFIILYVFPYYYFSRIIFKRLTAENTPPLIEFVYDYHRRRRSRFPEIRSCFVDGLSAIVNIRFLSPDNRREYTYRSTPVLNIIQAFVGTRYYCDYGLRTIIIYVIKVSYTYVIILCAVLLCRSRRPPTTNQKPHTETMPTTYCRPRFKGIKISSIPRTILTVVPRTTSII